MDTESRSPVVRLDDAVAVLGGFPALAGASIEIDHGEILLLRGPNGAGKTTLLRLCAGLVPLARGAGEVLGHDLSDESGMVALPQPVPHPCVRSVRQPSVATGAPWI